MARTAVALLAGAFLAALLCGLYIAVILVWSHVRYGPYWWKRTAPVGAADLTDQRNTGLALKVYRASAEVERVVARQTVW